VAAGGGTGAGGSAGRGGWVPDVVRPTMGAGGGAAQPAIARPAAVSISAASREGFECDCIVGYPVGGTVIRSC
jgi:hypothetical protein